MPWKNSTYYSVCKALFLHTLKRVFFKKKKLLGLAKSINFAAVICKLYNTFLPKSKNLFFSKIKQLDYRQDEANTHFLFSLNVPRNSLNDFDRALAFRRIELHKVYFRF